ncbi:hypothetical protein A6770_28700 [Nostoc minutum NIES-26]|uniref:Uncharacterized protein n=1 Tax=Nostoc minutum NIES-26 TaxID=1844469 RepID=A0A367QIU4_9NOSO|nr:hypothetical protein A6770_28700 [Nostoc minutum NIES-26]
MCHPDMQMLINAGILILNEIAKHPDFKALDYQPDVTIADAQAAITYLKNELESNQQSSSVSKTSI